MSNKVDESIQRIRKIINESDMIIEEDKWLVIELLNKHKEKNQSHRPFLWKEMHHKEFDDS